MPCRFQIIFIFCRSQHAIDIDTNESGSTKILEPPTDLHPPYSTRPIPYSNSNKQPWDTHLYKIVERARGESLANLSQAALSACVSMVDSDRFKFHAPLIFRISRCLKAPRMSFSMYSLRHCAMRTLLSALPPNVSSHHFRLGHLGNNQFALYSSN